MKNVFWIEGHPSGSNEISALVLAADIESPFEHLHDVEKKLTESNIHGLVIFDLLVSHGNNRNRFFSAFFNGRTFTGKDFKSEQKSYSIYSQLSAPHLKTHAKEINHTLLSTAMKYAIREGIPL
ncbi:type II toxin-antitoxin system RnlB family antitoxin [Pseudomonas sp. P1B16]|uniref:type II toxin-antitoxin system RnlB family antitoxin n=1 Tax=Pseudomonas sp. P1B16 TaxID=2986074 RepID=UPI002A24DCBD|nr:type II toxin-antitoxin system RnlB family antitoxin [Pseudomonas sp. P1B16]WPM27003.1 type II toxin-antitoxin system RnlB family antitoxin [Pseudomonas sp. P1B16]